MSEVKIRRVLLGNDHDDAKFFVIEGYVDGIPEVTKRTAINSAALAEGKVLLADEKAKLIATVEEYLARWRAIQEAEKEL